MAAGRARVLLVVAALLLAAASAWWFGARESGSGDSGERDLVERARTDPLAAAMPSTTPNPHLEGRGGPAPNQGGDEDEGIPFTVTVTTSDGGTGEARVEGGRDDASLQFGDIVRFGEPTEVFVPVGTRVVRVEGNRGSAALYEPVDVRHDPARGPLTVRLERGKVSIHARVVDEQDRPLYGVSLYLSGIHLLDAGVLERTTDMKGEARWEGLVRAIPDLPGVSVRAWTGPAGFDAGGNAEIVWDASRTRGSVAFALRRTGLRLAVPAAELGMGWYLERRAENGGWTVEGWPGALRGRSPTDPGSFTFASAGLLAGDYRITIRGTDGMIRRAEFVLVHGEISTVTSLQTVTSESVPGRLTGPGVGRIRQLGIVGPPPIVRTLQGLWTVPVAADGTFVLHRPEWMHSVLLAAPHFPTLTVEDMAALASDPSGSQPPVAGPVLVLPRLLRLESGSRIELATVIGVTARGIVRDAQGAPVAGVAVLARARSANPEARDATHPEWFDEKTNMVRTDDRGRFEGLEGPPGSWTFTVRRKGKPAWDSPEAVPIPGTGEVILTVP